MKKIVIPILIAVFTISLFTTATAEAGSKQRHRWEGVAIGMGAAVLGSVIWDGMFNHRPHHPHHHGPVVVEKYPYYPPPPRGHWEIQRRYIPPRYERVWNPGHYNHHGNWIPGHWMNIEKAPGRWIEERVWVTHR